MYYQISRSKILRSAHAVFLCVVSVFWYSNNWLAVAVFFLEFFAAVIYIYVHFYFTFAIVFIQIG
jgi:hypothetical protein